MSAIEKYIWEIEVIRYKNQRKIVGKYREIEVLEGSRLELGYFSGIYIRHIYVS
jgi:hypothetical protein